MYKTDSLIVYFYFQKVQYYEFYHGRVWTDNNLCCVYLCVCCVCLLCESAFVFGLQVFKILALELGT